MEFFVKIVVGQKELQEVDLEHLEAVAEDHSFTLEKSVVQMAKSSNITAGGGGGGGEENTSDGHNGVIDNRGTLHDGNPHGLVGEGGIEWFKCIFRCGLEK